MTRTEQKVAIKGFAAGAVMGMALALIIALFILLRANA